MRNLKKIVEDTNLEINNHTDEDDEIALRDRLGARPAETLTDEEEELYKHLESIYGPYFPDDVPDDDLDENTKPNSVGGAHKLNTLLQKFSGFARRLDLRMITVFGAILSEVVRLRDLQQQNNQQSSD
jgi:hypothetical protein